MIENERVHYGTEEKHGFFDILELGEFLNEYPLDHQIKHFEYLITVADTALEAWSAYGHSYPVSDEIKERWKTASAPFCDVSIRDSEPETAKRIKHFRLALNDKRNDLQRLQKEMEKTELELVGSKVKDGGKKGGQSNRKTQQTEKKTLESCKRNTELHNAYPNMPLVERIKIIAEEQERSPRTIGRYLLNGTK